MALVRMLGAILSLIVLTGCQDAFDVRIDAGADRVDNLAFTIVNRDAPEARPRYDSVRLVDPHSKAVLWHLRAAPFGTEASQSGLRFGATPAGFEAVVVAPALEAGREYVLIVSGKARGQLRFRVDAGGQVRKVG